MLGPRGGIMDGVKILPKAKDEGNTKKGFV